MSAHLVRTTHHDTDAVDFFCGESREVAVDPDPTDPVCTRCLLGALESVRGTAREDVRALAEAVKKGGRDDFQRVLGWVDDITLRLERLERKADKKRAKR